jgi:pSer/pThr/pTyr-binding forkhead associated (FHA) protein
MTSALTPLKNFFDMENYSENQERHVLIVNSDERRAYALEAAAYSVGRDASNAIVLDFETVSRQHALFLRVPNPITHRYEYRVIDGNAEGKPSANGLFINGKQIKSQTLKNGDSIEFGQHVKVAYLTLSMGEAEFVNYLESISYQSLKSELIDTKATMVGVGFDEMFADTPRPLSEKPTPSFYSTAPKQTAKWQQTLHDAEKVSNSGILNLDNSLSSGPKKSGFRLWMPLALGMFTLLGAGGLFIFWQQLPEQSLPETQSSTTQESGHQSSIKRNSQN